MLTATVDSEKLYYYCSSFTKAQRHFRQRHEVAQLTDGGARMWTPEAGASRACELWAGKTGEASLGAATPVAVASLQPISPERQTQLMIQLLPTWASLLKISVPTSLALRFNSRYCMHIKHQTIVNIFIEA